MTEPADDHEGTSSAAQGGRQPTEPSGDVLSAPQAAALLGAHVETVRRLARRGGIPAFKIGKDWRFSRAALQQWTLQPPSGPGTSSGESAALVLVVDDEEPICRATVRMLERAGHRARYATSGPEALEVASSEPPDLVLLDLAMPGMTGPEVLERLRASRPDLPVVIVTGYPDSELMHQAAQFPPLMLLSKPAEPGQLEQTVRAALGVRRTERRAG